MASVDICLSNYVRLWIWAVNVSQFEANCLKYEWYVCDVPGVLISSFADLL